MDRLTFMKKRLFDGYHKRLAWWGKDKTIFGKDPGTEKLPLVRRKALAVDLVCREMPLNIQDRELIVGTSLLVSIGFGREIPRYETDAEAAEAARHGLSRKSIYGHHLPYYPLVLEKGYSGLIRAIDEKLACAAPEDTEKIDFWTAAKETLLSASFLAGRYSALAREMAGKETDSERRAELEEISRVCAKVPVQPAETFREALQSVWSVHMLLHSTLSMTPLGRLDQVLLPYYEKDLAEGRLTEEEAEELIGCFLIKFNERVQVNRDDIRSLIYENGEMVDFNGHDYNLGQAANHWLQSLTLGGQDIHGRDQSNALSYMFIKMVNRLELISPLVNVRIGKNTPKAFLDFISAELCRGGAQPAVFNDDVIIKGLIENMRYTPEEACDYGTDGCWEVLIWGRSEINFVNVEVLKVMESMFNHGKNWLYDGLYGPDIGDAAREPATFEDFYAAFIAQLEWHMRWQVRRYTEMYDHVHRIAPDPLLSCFVPDCIEKGRDITDKGARHSVYGLLVTGLSHCVDSLCAVRKLVYEKHIVTLPEYVDILKHNWAGHEDLRLTALNRTPKYGNNDPESNDILRRFADDFCTCAEKLNREVDWLDIMPGIATFESFAMYGHTAAASFDGRFDGEAFSSNYSPAVGRDKQGPGAVLLSSAVPDLKRMCMGCPIDMRFSFRKETVVESASLLRGLLESFVAVNGCMLTLTKVDTETLKKAQEHPEDYPSLRVRLGGVTTYFVQLARAQQDEYIRRTEQAM